MSTLAEAGTRKRPRPLRAGGVTRMGLSGSAAPHDHVTGETDGSEGADGDAANHESWVTVMSL